MVHKGLLNTKSHGFKQEKLQAFLVAHTCEPVLKAVRLVHECHITCRR